MPILIVLGLSPASLRPRRRWRRQRPLPRPVHLGLDHVDRAAGRIRALVVQRAERRHRRIHQPLAHRLALEEHGVGGHQVTHIAHQQQRAPLEHQRLALGVLVAAIGIELAGDGLAALFERVLERPGHEPEPVAIDPDLVLGIHRRDRILAVLDGRQRRLDDHVAEPRRMRGPDLARRIDHQHHMQPIVPQHDLAARFGAAIAHEGARIAQPRPPGRQVDFEPPRRAVLDDVIAGHLGMAAAGERKTLVEELRCPAPPPRRAPHYSPCPAPARPRGR